VFCEGEVVGVHDQCGCASPSATMSDASTDEPADVRLTNALLRLKVKENKTNLFSLGPLRGHALLFPELFQTTSLGLLGSLFQKSRIGATAKSTLPGFQVHFGAGSFRERLLFLFFDSVLQFQDRKDFSQVLDHGYSISVMVDHITRLLPPSPLFQRQKEF
jgi:hypothetical protein